MHSACVCYLNVYLSCEGGGAERLVSVLRHIANEQCFMASKIKEHLSVLPLGVTFQMIKFNQPIRSVNIHSNVVFFHVRTLVCVLPVFFFLDCCDCYINYDLQYILSRLHFQMQLVRFYCSIAHNDHGISAGLYGAVDQS